MSNNNPFFDSASNPRNTIYLQPQKYSELNSLAHIMDRIEHKLAFRAQLYLYSFIAIALSLLLVGLSHLFLPLLAAGLSLIAVAVTCVLVALVVLWFDRRISNSVRGELAALDSKLNELDLLSVQNNKEDLNLYAHMYLEAGMTLLFQSQAIPNKGENFMAKGHDHLANLAISCEKREELCLTYAQMHELYKVLCGHSKGVEKPQKYDEYKKQMDFYDALKRWDSHQQKVEAYEAEPTSKLGRWLNPLRFWRKPLLAYHHSQSATMKANALAIANTEGKEALPKSTLTTALKNKLTNNNVNENVDALASYSNTTKRIFSAMGSTINSLDVGMDYLKHGFVNRVFHEVTSVGKGIKGAVELLTPNKFGKHAK